MNNNTEVYNIYEFLKVYNIRQCKLKYNREHKEEANINFKKYYQNHKEYYKEYHNNNKDKIYKYQSNYLTKKRNEDPDERKKYNAYARALYKKKKEQIQQNNEEQFNNLTKNKNI